MERGETMDSSTKDGVETISVTHRLAVAQTLAMFDVIRPLLRPEVAKEMDLARRAYEAELPKRKRERVEQRGDLVRHLANMRYRPKGLSDHRIAEKIYSIALRINPDRQYLKEPEASVSKLVRLNDGVPSKETIRKDLR